MPSAPGFLILAISREQKIIPKRNKIQFRGESWYLGVALTKFRKTIFFYKCYNIKKTFKSWFLDSLTSFLPKILRDSQIWTTGLYSAGINTQESPFTGVEKQKPYTSVWFLNKYLFMRIKRWITIGSNKKRTRKEKVVCGS